MEEIFLKKVLLFLGAAAILMVLYPIYIFSHQDQIKKTSVLSALLAGSDGVLSLDQRTKSADCKVNGPLPDHECTPGEVFSDATLDKICVSGYAQSVRSVSASEKKKVYEEYGTAYPPAFGTYEANHLIPLALGGDNSIANLFPEAADPYPGFKEKDVVENYLHQEVCAGHIALSVAREKIATDWVSIYNNLDPQTIKELKSEFKTWAN